MNARLSFLVSAVVAAAASTWASPPATGTAVSAAVTPTARNAATGPAATAPTSVADVVATTPAPAVASADAPRSATKPATIQHDGQTFVLVHTTSNERVATDEYVPAGEKLGTWTQLITVQRLHLASATSPGALLAYVRGSVGEEHAEVNVLREIPDATVFAVQFPRSERNEEQRMICLALADAHDPSVLNVVQYAIKPAHFEADAVAAQVNAWRDRFLAQAPGEPAENPPAAEGASG